MEAVLVVLRSQALLRTGTTCMEDDAEDQGDEGHRSDHDERGEQDGIHPTILPRWLPRWLPERSHRPDFDPMPRVWQNIPLSPDPPAPPIRPHGFRQAVRPAP